MVGSGNTFGVGGHHFARLPIALLRAIAGSDVKDLRYISWAGGLPLELLLEAGAVAEIDICFSSLDIFGLPPRFRAAAETNALPVRDWTALAMIQALRAAQQNLPSMPFQLPEGSDMMARMPHAKVVRDPVSGAEIGIIPALRIDTFVLHVQRADESGNVQVIGPRALDFAMAGAARQVLVTVEEIVPVGALSNDGRQSILTRNQVSAIALAAWRSLSGFLPAFLRDRLPSSLPRLRRQGNAVGGQPVRTGRRDSRDPSRRRESSTPTLFPLSLLPRYSAKTPKPPSTRSSPRGSPRSSATTALPAPAPSRRSRMSPTGWQRRRTHRTC